MTEALRLYFVVLALGFNLPMGISGGLFVALIASLLTAIPFTPAGLGTVEWCRRIHPDRALRRDEHPGCCHRARRPRHQRAVGDHLWRHHVHRLGQDETSTADDRQRRQRAGQAEKRRCRSTVFDRHRRNGAQEALRPSGCAIWGAWCLVAVRHPRDERRSRLRRAGAGPVAVLPSGGQSAHAQRQVVLHDLANLRLAQEIV